MVLRKASLRLENEFDQFWNLIPNSSPCFAFLPLDFAFLVVVADAAPFYLCNIKCRSIIKHSNTK